MTTASISRLRAHATEEQRREALLELAEQISVEDRFQGKPLTHVLGLIVPPLCSATVAADVTLTLEIFDLLVWAVAEHSRYTSNPTDYAAAHEWPTTPAGLDGLDQRLRSDVDAWADRLMGRS